MKKSRSVAAAHDDDDNGDDRSLPVANDDDDDDDEQPARLTCNLVIIDQDNVRAAMGWLAGRDFRECVRRWVAAQPPGTLALVEVDEGKRSERSGPHVRLDGDLSLVIYSGPRWRADDGIVRDVEWWMAKLDASANVLVVSSDKLVRRRCADVKSRLGFQGRLRYESGEAFGYLLPVSASSVSEAAAPTASSDEAATVTVSVAELPAVEASPAGVDASLAHARQGFLRWVNETQPRPSQTASAFVHAGAQQRRGSKRRLGVYR